MSDTTGAGSVIRVVRRIPMSRPLTSAEEQLVRLMLEHDELEARAFLPQLERAQVTDCEGG